MWNWQLRFWSADWSTFLRSRTNALCIWLLAGVLSYQNQKRRCKKEKEYEMASWFSGLLASAGTICAGIWFYRCFIQRKQYILKLDSILSRRLLFQKDGGLMVFHIRTVFMQGNGEVQRHHWITFSGQFYISICCSMVWSCSWWFSFCGDHRIESKKRKRRVLCGFLRSLHFRVLWNSILWIFHIIHFFGFVCRNRKEKKTEK